MKALFVAKMEVKRVKEVKAGEQVNMKAIEHDNPGKDSTFSKGKPTATMVLIITDPALFGTVVEGDVFEVPLIKQ